MRKMFRSKRKGPYYVAILGSGPAGLFAAQAVYDSGNVAHIFSRGERSPLYGAQYLHAPVPGFDCGDAQQVAYILKGSAESYRRKVYGDVPAGLTVSPEVLQPLHEAWDIRKVYDQAWDRFKGIITPGEITTYWLDNGFEGSGYDLVVFSLPLISFCQAGHQFRSQEIWAQGDAPDLGISCSVTVEPWTIIANGEDSPSWYRASNVFGHRTVEWPYRPKPPVEGLAKVHKAVSTNCDCWSEIGGAPVVRVGRYGTWFKGEFSHRAYDRTMNAIEKLA